MVSINDSVLLMMVGMLNFLGAILLAHARVNKENVESAQFPPFPVQASETVRGPEPSSDLPATAVLVR